MTEVPEVKVDGATVGRGVDEAMVGRETGRKLVKVRFKKEVGTMVRL